MSEGKKIETIKIILLVLGVTLIGIFSFVAIVNILDWKVDFLNINPSEQSHTKTVYLTYPPTHHEPFNLIDEGGGGDIINPLLFSVDIFLQYDGVLTEGSKVDIAAVGWVYPNGEKELPIIKDEYGEVGRMVAVGFEGASPYNPLFRNQSDYAGQINVRLQNVQIRQMFDPKYVKMLPKLKNITWENQGDFEPYITFVSSNYTVVTVSYPNYKIHVSGADVKRQERYARIQTSLTIVLFFFTVIASIGLLVPLIPKRWFKQLGFDVNENDPKNSENATPDNNKTGTKTESPPPQIPHNPPPKPKKKR